LGDLLPQMDFQPMWTIFLPTRGDVILLDSMVELNFAVVVVHNCRKKFRAVVSLRNCIVFVEFFSTNSAVLLAWVGPKILDWISCNPEQIYFYYKLV
jgi:hypothetical protein